MWRKGCRIVCKSGWREAISWASEGGTAELTAGSMVIE
jgi:hypothetical protein